MIGTASIRKPATPKHSQKSMTRSTCRRTSWLCTFEVGLEAVEAVVVVGAGHVVVRPDAVLLAGEHRAVRTATGGGMSAQM